MKLSGKTALITGGSSGLGFALAKVLLAKKCRVYIMGRNKVALKEAAKKLNSTSLHILYADVTDYKKIVDQINTIPTIDVLINCAGVWLEGRIDKNNEEDINRTIDVNVKGTIFTTKAVLPKMLASKSGFILNISSKSGLKARREKAVYVASKFAITGFTKSLQLDLALHNIKVAAIYPAAMNTQLFAKAGFSKEIQKWMNPDKVAMIIVFMLEQEGVFIDHIEVENE